MSNDMLGGITLANVAGLINDLFSKLNSTEGHVWLAAFKRFLRKENPWPKFPTWRTLDDHTIEVNLDAQPTLPFVGAVVEWPKSPAKRGWVTVQLRGDNLFVNGRRVVLHMEEGQKIGTIVGNKLRSALEAVNYETPCPPEF